MALKVYRTPIGFHDAYVAAVSQKAALAAWGTTKNLFARGDAEIVTDVTLTAEPLANPGTIVRRARGTTAEHVAALPRNLVGTSKKEPAPGKPSSKKTPRKPHPSRQPLDEAEAALRATTDRHADEIADIERRIARLEHERDALKTSQDRELAKIERARDEAKAGYDAAVRRWQG